MAWLLKLVVQSQRISVIIGVKTIEHMWSKHWVWCIPYDDDVDKAEYFVGNYCNSQAIWFMYCICVIVMVVYVSPWLISMCTAIYSYFLMVLVHWAENRIQTPIYHQAELEPCPRLLKTFLRSTKCYYCCYYCYCFWCCCCWFFFSTGCDVL